MTNPKCPKCGDVINDLRPSHLEAQDTFRTEDAVPLVAYACTNCSTLLGVTHDPQWLADLIAKRAGALPR